MNSSPPSVLLRPARPEDASHAAPLLRLSMEPFADFYFSGHPHLSADEILSALFSSSGHRFSHRCSVLCEADGETAGLLVAFPGAHVTRLSAGLAFRLLAILGPVAFARLALRLIDYAGLRETGPREYYVAHLAVLPAARRRGLATLLMAHAEQQALARGLSCCSLFVDSHNAPAVQFYTRLGYQAVESQDSHYPGFDIPRRAYFRMLKDLSAASPGVEVGMRPSAIPPP